MKARGILFVIILTLFAAWLEGCSKEPVQEELTLLCGSSFVLPTQQLCLEFGKKTGIGITTTQGGSEDLLPHVKMKQQGDIFITHDPYLDYVRDAGALAGSARVGFLSPVLAVQKGNPKGLRSIEDLSKAGIRVALSNPEYSTCGEMVFRLLEKKGIKDGVLKNVENRLTKGHSQLGTFLKTQAVDAVIMWNGVANWFKDHVDVVKTPYEYDSEIQVHIIGLDYSKHPEKVKQFVAFAGERGAAIFAEHGYVK